MISWPYNIDCVHFNADPQLVSFSDASMGYMYPDLILTLHDSQNTPLATGYVSISYQIHI